MTAIKITSRTPKTPGADPESQDELVVDLTYEHDTEHNQSWSINHDELMDLMFAFAEYTGATLLPPPGTSDAAQFHICAPASSDDIFQLAKRLAPAAFGDTSMLSEAIKIISDHGIEVRPIDEE